MWPSLSVYHLHYMKKWGEGCDHRIVGIELMHTRVEPSKQKHQQMPVVVIRWCAQYVEWDNGVLIYITITVSWGNILSLEERTINLWALERSLDLGCSPLGSVLLFATLYVTKNSDTSWVCRKASRASTMWHVSVTVPSGYLCPWDSYFPYHRGTILAFTAVGCSLDGVSQTCLGNSVKTCGESTEK